jgi:transcriptional regulator with XRE-family HTH domain
MPNAQVDWYTDEMDDETIARELARVRREAQLTQEQLAARLNVSQSYVTKVETGKTRPTFSGATQWAQACGCMLDVRLTPSAGADPLVSRAATLLPYAPPDLRNAIASLLEAVASGHARAVR